MCKNCNELKERGFEGFFSFKELRESKCGEIPDLSGVYIVINHIFKKKPDFLKKGTGGWFKGRSPNVPEGVLEKKWNGVRNTKILYIGKGKSLRKRISQYEKFGRGRKVPKRGGRYIWQLPDSEQSVIVWKVVEKNPRQEEKGLLKEFELKYKNLPFANLRY